MSKNPTFSGWFWAFSASLACVLFAIRPLHAQSQIERSGIADISSDHGPIQPLRQITLTVHLKMRNQAAFDKAIDDLYFPGSPTYHQWMTDSDIERYAPTPVDVETVKKELESHGLSVLSVSPDNLSIRVRGPASDVERAFQTQIHEFERQRREHSGPDISVSAPMEKPPSSSSSTVETPDEVTGRISRSPFSSSRMTGWVDWGGAL